MKAKLLLGGLVLFAGLAVGLLLQYSQRSQLQNNLSAAQQQLASCQATSQLWELRDAAALLGLEAARSNYGAASEYSSRFFDRVRDLANQTSDPNLKSVLVEIQAARDKTTAGLAKEDPAVLPEIQLMVAKVHQQGQR
jgi:hypothetical protein